VIVLRVFMPGALNQPRGNEGGGHCEQDLRPCTADGIRDEPPNDDRDCRYDRERSNGVEPASAPGRDEPQHGACSDGSNDDGDWPKHRVGLPHSEGFRLC
jgi:hypothetical protein